MDDWNLILAVNTTAPLVVAQEVARNMIERKVAGAIVNVSSQASLVALPGHTAYCASKAALDSLTRTMAQELGPHGIRVNSVNPTVILTEMAAHWLEPAKRDPMLAQIPLRRFGTPPDVAHMVAFLLSDSAAMITGAEIKVDGGFTCQ